MSMPEQHQLSLRLTQSLPISDSFDYDATDYLNTLGIAQYRCEKYPAAFVTLTISDFTHAFKAGRSIPEDLAFLAMTHHQLGNHDQAKALLAKLRETMKKGEPSDDAKAFLKEAEELIRGAKDYHPWVDEDNRESPKMGEPPRTTRRLWRRWHGLGPSH